MLCLILSLMGRVNGWSQSLDTEAIAESVARYEALFTEEATPHLMLELQRLVPLLPRSVLRRVVKSDSVLITQNARNAVLTWWRSQDPLPASEVNERMVEHVQRVQYALEHYVCPKCEMGYDERGEIYVRYGAPERITQIVFDDPLLLDAVFQPGIAVSPGDFPDNEFWRYLNLDRDAYFLFVRNGNQYRVGSTSDLLPSVLRAGIGHGGRGQVKSKMLLAAMRSIYRQLALEHVDFGSRFNDVDQWFLTNEQAGRLRSRDPLENARIITGARRLTQGERSEPLEFLQDISQPASIFAQSMLLGAQTEDQQVAYQRETLLPPSASDVLHALPKLDVGVRHARFLKPDGTTTIEIYWHPESGGFHAPGHTGEEGHIIQTYAEVRDPSYIPLHVSTDAIHVQIPDSDQEMSIPAQIIQMDGNTGLYHLALQWDQYEIIPEGVGERVQFASMRIDSLYALDASGLALEMSDLKPLVYTDMDESFPWPHTWIQKEMRFGLGFEIYHLTYGPGDRTSYTVAYEVTTSRRHASSTSVDFEGQNRMEQEELLLDLGQRSGEILVTVRIRDHISGSEVSRSIILVMLGDHE